MRSLQWLPPSMLILGLAASCWGQKTSYYWRSYKLADGLPESACISVTVSPQGKVLVRHFAMPFVSELDGYTIRRIPSPEIGRSRVYQSPGGQLWAVVSGGLQEFSEGDWVLHQVPELGNPAQTSSKVIDPIPLWPVRQGLVLLLLPDRLLEYNSEDPQHPQSRVLHLASQTRLGSFSGFTPSHDGGLWVCGERGLAKVPGPVKSFRPETEWTEYLPPEQLRIKNFQGLHEDEDGGVVAVADSSTNQQRVVVFFDGQDWTIQPISSDKLRQAWRSVDRTRWAMSTETLFQGEEARPEFYETDEVAARAYFDVAVQPGATFWLATSDGLFRYAPPLWRTPVAAKRLAGPIRCLAGDAASGLWFISGTKLCVLQNEQIRSYAFPAVGQHLQPRGVYALRSGVVVLVLEDPESNGADVLFSMQSGTTMLDGPIVPEVPADSVRVVGMLKDNRLCIQRFKSNGVQLTTGLLTFDGTRFEPMTTPELVPELGTNLHAMYQAQNGDWWLSSEAGTAVYSQEKWHVFSPTADKSNPEGALGFVELPDGRIWCATPALLWEYDGHAWSALQHGFDGINGLLRARDNSIWVASNNGLLRYYQQTWIENGPEEGLPSSAVRDIYEDPRGRLWAATTRGLSLFHPEADTDPPQTYVQIFPGPEASLTEGGTISLTFTGQDKWKYTPRERLLYSYRMDVKDWTAFQETARITLSDLAAGKHYFQVRAMDRNGNFDAQGARRELVVIGPWYHETRLVLISCAGGVAALFFAGLAFNRHWRLSRSYAEVEKKVAERTRQLEIANRELVHSQKMNALGTLAAGIAHDFNNILSIVKGSTQIIEENLDNPDKIRTRTDRIKLVVEQGAGIVKAMLGFSRDSGREPALCDLNEVVQDTLKLLGDRFLREVQIRSETTPGLPAVLAAKDFIQQILLNFIFNAAESMESGKLIVLSTRLISELPTDLVLTPVPASRYVTVSVRDSGCGIPAENLSRIFEPFFTTKALSTRRGTGLGLSMAYELAKKLGAGLVVASKEGEGSTFTLILPVRELPET